MFGTIRKHQTWLWVFLVVVMSLGLVVFFTPNDFADGGSQGPVDLGSIDGKPIGLSEYQKARSEVRIRTFLFTGKWPGSDESSGQRLEDDTLHRVFLVRKLAEMDIKASDKAVGRLMQDQLRDASYDMLEKEILQPNELTLADYERYARHEAAIQQLITAASVSARLVNPADAEALWRKENREITGQLACFWSSNYLSKVVITNGAIAGFYSNNIVSYRIPDRISLSYVAFPASNYLSEADTQLGKMTNLNELLAEEYFRRGRVNANAWTDTNGVALPEAAAKEKIRDEVRQNFALVAARRAANDFGNELITQTNANDAANLERIATAKGLKVAVTQPFVPRPFGTWTNGLEEFDLDPVPAMRADDNSVPSTLRDVIRQKAAALPDDRPVLFSPILGKHGVYVIAKKAKIPFEQQPLSKIEEKVTTDYKTFMAFSLASRAGMAFHTNLTNGLTLKKSFAELCAAEKVPVLDLPPFSSSTPSLTNADPRINFRQLRELADKMEVGKVSQFSSALPRSEGGYIFYLASHPPIDPAKLKAELPDFINRLRTIRQGEAVNRWFMKQAEQAKVSRARAETAIGAQN